MADDDPRRAPAKCIQCGTISVVHVWPDGTRRPLGQSAFCDCAEPELRELEEDVDSDDEPP